MSPVPTACVSVTFEPTDEEWRLVETRAAFRALIGERGLSARLAPVALFAAAACAILAGKWGGWIGARAAQIALVAALAGFVVANSLVKRAARGRSRRRVAALRVWKSAGALTLEADASRTSMSGPGWRADWAADAAASGEAFEGLLLLWSGHGPPAFAPSRSLSAEPASALAAVGGLRA